MTQPTPAQLAEYDQQYALINNHIDILTHAYNETLKQHPPEAVTITFARHLEKLAPTPESLAQYLTVTIHRLNELQTAINAILTRYHHLTGEHLPAAMRITTDTDTE